MSKIPVEKKSGGMPWWAWLLIAIAVIVVIWLLWAFFAGTTAGALLAPALAALIILPVRWVERTVTDDEKEVVHDA